MLKELYHNLKYSCFSLFVIPSFSIFSWFFLVSFSIFRVFLLLFLLEWVFLGLVFARKTMEWHGKRPFSKKHVQFCQNLWNWKSTSHRFSLIFPKHTQNANQENSNSCDKNINKTLFRSPKTYLFYSCALFFNLKLFFLFFSCRILRILESLFIKKTCSPWTNFYFQFYTENKVDFFCRSRRKKNCMTFTFFSIYFHAI